jgi:hypothetical protein
MAREDGQTSEAPSVTRSETIIDVPIDWPSAEPRYRVTVGLRDAGDRFECARLSVAAITGNPIGSAVMRGLPVGSLISEAIHRLDVRAIHAEMALLNAGAAASSEIASQGMALLTASPTASSDMSRFLDEAYWQSRKAAMSEKLGSPSGKGTGRRYPPGHLEAVAETVREARWRGDPAETAVATVFGITKSAAANQISRARALGLLDSQGSDETIIELARQGMRH